MERENKAFLADELDKMKLEIEQEKAELKVGFSNGQSRFLSVYFSCVLCKKVRKSTLSNWPKRKWS